MTRVISLYPPGIGTTSRGIDFQKAPLWAGEEVVTMDCPVYLSERPIGRMEITPGEDDTCFTARASAPPGLYRLYARGEGGELLLGVWEGGPWRRRYSRSMTAPLGNITAVRAEKSDDGGWRRDLRPFARWPAGLYRRTSRGWLLALPYREDGPFPLPELFCLARVGRVEGQMQVVFALDEEGNPHMMGEM
jgi:hypothetical protein